MFPGGVIFQPDMNSIENMFIADRLAASGSETVKL
jgi:hypothetical protein